MKVEISFHETTSRQTVENVVTVIYTKSVAVVYDDVGTRWVYPLVNVHRIKEIG